MYLFYFNNDNVSFYKKLLCFISVIIGVFNLVIL